MTNEAGWEAIVNDNEIDTYDPVVSIVIRTERHDYELRPEDVAKLVCRRRQPRHD